MILIEEKLIKRNHEGIEEKVIKSNINLTEEKSIQLEELMEMVDDLKAMVSSWKESNITNKKNLYIRNFKGDVQVKSIKVYKEVLEPFNRFVLEHKEFKQQDIINQALWEFLQKFQ
jgi:hypothetical protein